MTDSSPEISSENTEGEFSSPEEQTTQIVNQKIMCQIQQLVEQDKYAALLQVIELSMQHLNQRKEITNLQQYVKKVLEERVQIKSDLIVQHNFKTNLQSIEEVKQTTSKRLREKLETINAHIKSNDALRSHLKEDDAVARLEIEEIKKLLDGLTEKANVLQRALQKGEARLKEINQQLHSASVENAKLQKDCHAKECEIHTFSKKYGDMTQLLKKELIERETSTKQRVEELKGEQQNLVVQANMCEQLTSELNIMRNNVAQLKQTVESELSKEAQHFRKQIDFAEKSLADMTLENEKLLENMTNTVTDLNEQNKATNERIMDLSSKQIKLTNDLRSLEDSNSKLKQELDNYNRNKHQEFVRLKKSIKANRTSPVATAANKLNLPWNIRQKRQSSKNNNEPTTKNSTICVPSESDLSYAFDTSVHFEGKL